MAEKITKQMPPVSRILITAAATLVLFALLPLFTAVITTGDYSERPKFDLADGIVAFDAQHLGETTQSIYVTTGKAEKFLKLAQGRTPDISPNGTQIVFAATKSGNSEIYIMDSDGSNQRLLARSKGIDAYPRFSADGKNVVFFSNRDGTSQIYQTATGSKNALAQLTYGPNDKFDPSFSHDGQSIFYNERQNQRMQILQMDVRSGSVKNLMRSNFNDIHPSPDLEGKRLLFRSDRTVNFEIYQMDISTGNATMVSNGAGSKRHPQYSPAGQYAIFHAVFAPGDAAISIVDLSDLRKKYTLPRIAGAQLNPSWARSPKIAKIIEARGAKLKCVAPLQKLWSAATNREYKLLKTMKRIQFFQKICSIQ